MLLASSTSPRDVGISALRIAMHRKVHCLRKLAIQALMIVLPKSTGHHIYETNLDASLFQSPTTLASQILSYFSGALSHLRCIKYIYRVVKIVLHYIKEGMFFPHLIRRNPTHPLSIIPPGSFWNPSVLFRRLLKIYFELNNTVYYELYLHYRIRTP